MVLPVVFVPFIIGFPTGLVLYWVTTNLWTVGQGLITRRLIPKPAAPEKRSSRTPRRPAPAPAAALADGGGSAPASGAAQAKPQPQGPPRKVRRKKKRSRR
jgi:YidC/Oxa1 family membrane protein insertase